MYLVGLEDVSEEGGDPRVAVDVADTHQHEIGRGVEVDLGWLGYLHQMKRHHMASEPEVCILHYIECIFGDRVDPRLSNISQCPVCLHQWNSQDRFNRYYNGRTLSYCLVRRLGTLIMVGQLTHSVPRTCWANHRLCGVPLTITVSCTVWVLCLSHLPWPSSWLRRPHLPRRCLRR